MNIDDVRDQKAAAERCLLAKLHDFEQETGCSVRSIWIDRVETTTILSTRRGRLSAVRFEVEIE
jgi:hypothetical protein